MPASGEQHKSSFATANPFDDAKSHIGQDTAQEIATLQSRLEKQLGPEYISSRPGAGGHKVFYLAAEKCINLANEVFGFNGWSSSIQNIQVDFADEIPSSGKISVGISVIVRVTLRDGTFHEDVGYGQSENCKSKATAFDKAKKEGTTDALKRALRNFGNVLGNCLYDRDYLTKVTKLKIAPSKWDENNLHRHGNYRPIKKEALADIDDVKPSFRECLSTVRSGEDEFGGDEFEEADFSVSHGGHPDEVTLESSNASDHFPRDNPRKHDQNAPVRRVGFQDMQAPKPPARVQSLPVVLGNGPQTPISNKSINGANINKFAATGQIPVANFHKPPPALPQQALAPHNRPQMSSLQRPHGDPQLALGGPRSTIQPPKSPQHVGSNGNDAGSTPPTNSSEATEHEPPVGFFTARAAETLQNTAAVPSNVPLFNPHLESPSIRKTAGIDHTKTKPVNRETLGAPQQSTKTPVPVMRGNFVNPQADQARRIGMPGGAGSPLQNRTSYKPPQMMKRPADGNSAQFLRPPLNDVTSASANTPNDSGGDVKRQKVMNGSGLRGGGGGGGGN